jgi:hypothetical protein
VAPTCVLGATAECWRSEQQASRNQATLLRRSDDAIGSSDLDLVARLGAASRLRAVVPTRGLIRHTWVGLLNRVETGPTAAPTIFLGRQRGGPAVFATAAAIPLAPPAGGRPSSSACLP